MKVKIFVITRRDDLFLAVKAGADALGFIVNISSSPRNISLERAKKLIKKTPIFIDTVLVTKPKSLKELIKIIERLKPKTLQIYEDNFSILE
ncbi:MAG: phosphoribosylanthranilate isomerase, partial [Candidatus Bathyarchaeia archaeon]